MLKFYNLKIGILLFAVVFSKIQLRADEGMWPISLISQLEDKMKARGLNLTAADIYSINQSCLKDAVVRLMSKQGRMFCTGEIVSKESLFITNHHCGYGAIQELSSDKDNILNKGFWATSKNNERPANFNIGLLRNVEEVTSKVLNNISEQEADGTRNIKIGANIDLLKKEALASLGADAANYQVEIVAFWNNNRYMAMYYEVFKDIRLVGTPPESVGKFGGEADNWRWPRHTGDFSMFRIYANASNKPANFENTNVPYVPKKHFKISLKGYEEGDYAMIMGYPGRTARYTYSEGIKFFGNKERPYRVALRRTVMDVYEKYMKKDTSIRLKYSDKLAGIGNYWNKFNGEAKDLSKPGLFEISKARENAFEKWVKANNKTAEYGNVTSLYDEYYLEMNKIGLYGTYFADGISNSQAMVNALSFSVINELLVDTTAKNKKMGADNFNDLSKNVDATFSEYVNNVEIEVLEGVLKHVYTDLDPQYFSPYMVKLNKKFKGNFAAMAAALWNKSKITTKEKYAKLLTKGLKQNLLNDPLIAWVNDYRNILNVTLKTRLLEANSKFLRANRLFTSGILAMDEKAVRAPDANGTMRLTYGRVLEYKGADAITFNNFTTTDGILQKYVPGDFDFNAPADLIKMIQSKDFGQYADKNGKLRTCFLTDNDITGGNSGSPVLNANGELIGTAFDGNWEAISSDFAFIPALQRTINLDVRYLLWTVEKYGKASNIIAELDLVK